MKSSAMRGRRKSACTEPEFIKSQLRCENLLIRGTLPHLTSASDIRSNAPCYITWWSPLARPGLPFLSVLKEEKVLPVQ